LLLGKRTRDFAFVSLCYGRSGEEMCTGYAMAASGRMQYDYKQTNWYLLRFIFGESTNKGVDIPSRSSNSRRCKSSRFSNGSQHLEG